MFIVTIHSREANEKPIVEVAEHFEDAGAMLHKAIGSNPNYEVQVATTVGSYSVEVRFNGELIASIYEQPLLQAARGDNDPDGIITEACYQVTVGNCEPLKALLKRRRGQLAPAEKHRTTILLHTIEWWVRTGGADVAPVTLDDLSQEHIKTCIADGFNQGELCIIADDGETEFRGWWSIVTE